MPVDGPQIRLYGRKSARQRGSVGADRVIGELAASQYGLVALSQLVELGLSVRAINGRVATGRLHRVHQGVYAVGHRLLGANGRRMAAVLACGPAAVLSHRSAAALWGIRKDGRGVIDVTAPGRRGRMPKGIAAHRHGSLRPPDRTIVVDIPCTSVPRTLLDLAGVVTASELRHAITQAEVLGRFDLGATNELIARSRRRRGVARLRLAIADHDPREEWTREELERRFLALCRKAELPRPEVNAPLLIEGDPIEADFLWRGPRLIVETDGRGTHGTATAFEQDRRRDRMLKLAGWDVIRCTWRQVRDEPSAITRAVRTLISRRPPG